MSITITVPNDDHVALRAMAKALEEIAVARGAPSQGVHVTMGKIDFNEPNPNFVGHRSHNAEADTTSQQVESLVDRVEDLLEVAEQPFQGEVMPTTDSNATPWDERIHSASKALNSDRTWRLRRKPADKTPEEWTAYVKWVEEDIHTVLHGQSEDSEEFKQILKECEEEAPKILEAMSQAFEPSVTPAGDDVHVDAGEVTEQQIAAILAPEFDAQQHLDELANIPVMTEQRRQEIKNPAIPVPPLPVQMTFPQVMQFLTERHGRITSAQVDDIIADMGLNSIMDLNTQTQHTGPFIARVKALLGE